MKLVLKIIGWVVTVILIIIFIILLFAVSSTTPGKFLASGFFLGAIACCPAIFKLTSRKKPLLGITFSFLLLLMGFILIKNFIEISKPFLTKNERLITAVQYTNMYTANELIKQGASPNASHYSQPILMIAIEQGNADMVKLLLQAGADPDNSGNFVATPLVSALSKGQTDIARLLIEQGANVNFRKYGSKTPLMEAVENNNFEIAELLIQSDVKLNLTDEANLTAVMYVGPNNLNLLKLLLDKDKNLTGERLYDSVIRDNRSEIKMLLDYGININRSISYKRLKPILKNLKDVKWSVLLKLNESLSSDTTGINALMVAAACGNTDLVRYLLSCGADPLAQDSKAHTAAEYAGFNEYNELEKFLKEQQGLPSVIEENFK